MFDGQRCLAHNASFDEAVYNRHFHTGIGPAEWQGRELSAHPAGPENDHAFRVVEYRRTSG